jgi:hypothetical protein
MDPSPIGERPRVKGHLPDEEDQVFHTQMDGNGMYPSRPPPTRGYPAF